MDTLQEVLEEVLQMTDLEVPERLHQVEVDEEVPEHDGNSTGIDELALDV